MSAGIHLTENKNQAPLLRTDSISDVTLSISYLSIHSSSPATYPHFPVGETEAQRDESTLPEITQVVTSRAGIPIQVVPLSAQVPIAFVLLGPCLGGFINIC